MKKNLLFICALLVATITFAQQRMMLMPEQAHLLSKNVQCMNPLSPPSPSSIAPPFFTDDFSNSNYWTMTDLTNGGAQNWVIGTNGPTGTFSAAMNAIASTSGGNFALFDSDALSIPSDVDALRDDSDRDYGRGFDWQSDAESDGEADAMAVDSDGDADAMAVDSNSDADAMAEGLAADVEPMMESIAVQMLFA